MENKKIVITGGATGMARATALICARHGAKITIGDINAADGDSVVAQIRDAGGVRQNLNDEWITARVRSRLLTDQSVKSVNVNIETYDGTVYLMGVAQNKRELALVRNHARSLDYVRRVVSHVRIKSDAAA